MRFINKDRGLSAIVRHIIAAIVINMSKPRMCTLVYLSHRDRARLAEISESPLSPAIRMRAQALLLSDRSMDPNTTDAKVAAELGVCRATIAAIRKRFAAAGVVYAIWPQYEQGERIVHLAQARPGELPYAAIELSHANSRE